MTRSCIRNWGAGSPRRSLYELHLIIRGALTDAHRRVLVTRNVALVAQAPKQRFLQKFEGVSLTDEELRLLVRTAAGHRFFPLYWLTAMTGMRRNEVLGLKWTDIDITKKRLHLNRGFVAVDYEIHQTRGKTKTARGTIDLDDTTIGVLEGWRAYQTAELAAVGIDASYEWVFTDGTANHYTPTPTRPARHASRSRPRRRTTHQPTTNSQEEDHQADREDPGGTPWEQTEERRLNRRNTI